MAEMAESAWRRGLADARRSMHSPLFWVLDAMLGLIVAGVVGVFTAGQTDDAVVQNAVPPSVGVAWLVMVVLALIGWNIARAPYRQRNELLATQHGTDVMAEAISGLASETKSTFVQQAQVFRRGRVRAADV